MWRGFTATIDFAGTKNMKPVVNQPSSGARTGSGNETRKQLRGSSLLLISRVLAGSINFSAQVLVIRYLSTTDFGALAYVLSFFGFIQIFVTLGLGGATARFVPIYHEKHEYEKLFGTIFLVVGTIVSTGLLVILAVHAVPEALLRALIDEQQPLLLLPVASMLIPVEAIDNLLTLLFASFARARAIFFRRLLVPALKLGMVLLVILWQRDVIFLAYGYLTISVLGVLIYSGMLIHLLHGQGLFQHFRLQTITVPVKELFTYALPLLMLNLLGVVMRSVNVFLLGYFHGTSEVAFFRVVLPAVLMNHLVMTSFTLLYTASAARLFAKQDTSSMNDLYWQTAAWMAILSFPIFVVTFSLAHPVTVLLYGTRYENSSIILAVLSLGYYCTIALGFNELTLKIVGKMRYVLILNVLAAILHIVVNLLLIPRYGALGAAIGTAGTMIVRSLLMQVSLRLSSGLRIFDYQYLSFYLLIMLSIFLLSLIKFFNVFNTYYILALVCLIYIILVIMSKKYLNVAGNFPELLKIPFMRRLFL